LAGVAPEPAVCQKGRDGCQLAGRPVTDNVFTLHIDCHYRRSMKWRYALHIVVCAGMALGLDATWQATALAQSKATSGSEVAPATGTERAGWHIVHGLPYCAQQFMNVATTGPDAAWVLGAGLASTGGCAADGIDVNYWNGAGWSLLPATTALPGPDRIQRSHCG
jgi:hypothetical protein